MYNSYQYIIANEGIDTAKTYPYQEQVHIQSYVLESKIYIVKLLV